MKFSEWYNDIIEKAEILDVRYPVKGIYVWYPYGFKIRKYTTEIIRKLLDEKGHEEVLFPLLIPEHEFRKEAEHIKGFEDEVYWVTHGGLEPLEVKLALRPTSETAMYPIFKLWIRSHADMPLKVYQIVSTFRYETKHTRPLIRLREITTFKEAHTVHATWEDAERQVKEAIEIYKKFFDTLGIPYIISRRPDWDKFPGAEYTMAFDTIFPDGRTLQIGTVHNLGQNFSKTFEITFENIKGKQEYAYQTCYGMSDRVIASIIAVHGDEKGLCLIPCIAPIQVVIIPIWFKGIKEEINKEAEKIKEELSDLRVHIDYREVRPGSKFFDWEIKGVPLRIEIGPKDIENNVVTAVRRDSGEKIKLRRENLKEQVKELLAKISEDMRNKAWEKFRKRIEEGKNIEEAKKLASKQKVIKTYWCGKDECAKSMENEIGLDILGINEKAKGKTCIYCNKKAKFTIHLAKTY